MKRVFRSMSKSIWSILIWGDIKTKLLCLVGIVVTIIAFGTAVAVIKFHLSTGDALWWSWTHVLDPGALGDDKDSIQRKLWGSLIAMLGLVLLGGAFITLSEEAARRAVDQLMQGRIPKGITGHTVIAGSGSKLKAFISSVKRLPWSGDNLLIVIPNQEALLQAREECGADHDLSLVVDRVWEDSQNRLGLAVAHRVLLLDNFGGDTGAMLKTILKIREARKSRNITSELKIYAEINDRALSDSVRTAIDEIEGDDHAMEIHIINISDAAARLTLRQHPLDCTAIDSDTAGVTLIIEGWTPFAQALFWQAVRVAHFPIKPTRIIVVAPGSDKIAAEVKESAPGLFDQWCTEQLLEVRFIDGAVPGELPEISSNIVTLAVCSGDADKAFSRALHCRADQLPGLKQILIELPDSSGYRDAISGMKKQGHIQLYPVGASAEAFELAENLDKAAISLHQRYLEQRKGKREKNPDGSYKSKSDYDWIQLDEIRRSWNRASADHIEVKLRALADYHKVGQRPVYDPAKTAIQCDAALLAVIKSIVDGGMQNCPPDLELLSKIEHDRWSAEKIAEGWSYAAVKDEVKKQSPYIQPYDLLSEEIKGYDREAVFEMLKSRVA